MCWEFAWDVLGSFGKPREVLGFGSLAGTLVMIASSAVKKVIGAVFLNLPGWCWARIKQLALIGSSSSLHSEACKALGGSDGVVHSTISLAAICIRAVAKDSAVTAARGDRRATCTPSGHSLHGLAPLRPHTVRPDSPQAEHRAPPALLEHLCHAAWRRWPAVGVAKVIPSRPFGYDQV